MTSLLRKRLFIGYFITGFIVISMVTAMINERCRLKELKNLIIQINEKVEYMKCLLNYDINYKNPILLGPVYKPLSSRQGKCDLPHFSVPHP